MNHRDSDICKAVKLRDASSLVSIFFEAGSPNIKLGFKTETDLWDYKKDVPFAGKQHANAWAHLAKDVLAFHNQKGGVIIFGFTDDFKFSGATQRLDSKMLNDGLRRFLPDTLWVEFHREFIQTNQRYVGLAIVPQRSGQIVRFIADAPVIGTDQLFKKGWASIRENDSSQSLDLAEIERIAREELRLHAAQEFYVNEPGFRVPAPDYVTFINRQDACTAIEEALRDPRTAVAHIIGIGGLGKTALATWAVIRAYDARQFSFIASCTAKDRELTRSGIASMEPQFTSFESLLNAICEILQFTEYKPLPVDEKEGKVRELLEGSGGLLYVDNLETVDDPRIIRFLDTLPVGVRAIVTSRRLTVKRSVYPITINPMNDKETLAYVRSLSVISSYSYVSDLSESDMLLVAKSCDHIPLAIRWVLSRSNSRASALNEAEALAKGGKRGEELLEFSFRRVFDNMRKEERLVVDVLSLFSQPQPNEVLLVGSGLKLNELQDVLAVLIDDAIVQVGFDGDKNHEVYSLMSITRSYVYSAVSADGGKEEAIRQRLRDYFEARDVKNHDERIVIQAIRKGNESSESALLDLAIAARRKGDLKNAELLFQEAISRNNRSWRSYRELGELNRHELNRKSEAIRCYEKAASCAPKDKGEKARIYREWGLLLRDSGQIDASSQATEKLETALRLNPQDVVTVTALAQMYERKGAWVRVIQLCEPWRHQVWGRARETMLPVLLRAYEHQNDLLKVAEVKGMLGM